MKDVHPMYSLSNPFFHRELSDVNAGIRSRLYNHDTLDFRTASSPSQHKDLLDSSLEILRKLTEYKKLKQDLSLIPIRQPYLQVTHSPSQSNNAHALPSELQIQDLEVIGYKGIVCQNCLIAHSLPIYRVKHRHGIKPILTKHCCNLERLSEIQQQQTLNKPDILDDLYFHQLPRRILESAKEWTKNNCTLMATEVAAPFEDCPLIDLLDQKDWAILAINNGSAVLTNEHLEDFIHTVTSATCAYFRIAENKGNEKSCRIFFMSLRRSHPTSCY